MNTSLAAGSLVKIQAQRWCAPPPELAVGVAPPPLGSGVGAALPPSEPGAVTPPSELHEPPRAARVATVGKSLVAMGLRAAAPLMVSSEVTGPAPPAHPAIASRMQER